MLQRCSNMEANGFTRRATSAGGEGPRASLPDSDRIYGLEFSLKAVNVQEGSESAQPAGTQPPARLLTALRLLAALTSRLLFASST